MEYYIHSKTVVKGEIGKTDSYQVLTEYRRVSSFASETPKPRQRIALRYFLGTVRILRFGLARLVVGKPVAWRANFRLLRERAD